ncbi:PP2C family serine/threonine-protein phosphatase [Salibacterium qingdaonense]|uniref:Negative regulator of sigma-B (Phosphoserine phosphatase) n=1 Tax=Salibacterium qingdaonense TaxID=266892 RepID=A0A1I4I834_9BACI|nr:PP2C family serine/threonine-protein phosphatase [Salibacterium qingdaonense]SFL50578.1 negative regulator of sigma-B (phosphoserine phosphatase) [Salibacterium qingdaonense]
MMIENPTHTKVEIAAFQQKKEGAGCCGDAYVTIETASYFLCALADGLGSGAPAHRSALIAMEVVREYHGHRIETILEQCNRALFQERGVVMTILKADFDAGEIIYGNIGNVETYLFSEDRGLKRPMPAPGYLSGRSCNYRIQKYPIEQGSHFVMHSDGITMSKSERETMKHSTSPWESIQYFSEKAQQQNDDTTVVIGHII